MLTNLSHGVFCKSMDSAFIEASGYAGLDFVILDMEHGAINLETLHHHVRAAKVANITSVVRVSNLLPDTISKALDSGVDAIQIPNINTVEQAKQAIEAARFYPKGQRGVCRFVKGASFGEMDRNDYFALANEKPIILQVEGIEGITNLDAILDLGGFNILFIGPYDLSQSVGKPGQIQCQEVQDQIAVISEKVQARGIVLGTFYDELSRQQALIDQGFKYLAYSVDVNIYLEACKVIVKGITK